MGIPLSAPGSSPSDQQHVYDRLGLDGGAMPAVEYVERVEPADVRQKRIENFRRHCGQLRPNVCSLIRKVDFRHPRETGDRNDLLSSAGRISVLPDGLTFEYDVYREAARLRTAALSEMALAAWPASASTGDDIEDGYISRRAREGMREDISELVAHIHAAPGFVRWACGESDIIKTKVLFLSLFGYISKDQLKDLLLNEGVSDQLEHGWRMLAGEGDLRRDIVSLIEAIEQDPCEVRRRVKNSPDEAAKIDYLFEERYITDRQYSFIMGFAQTQAPDLPYCAQPHCEYAGSNFLSSAGCMVGLGLRLISGPTASDD